MTTDSIVIRAEDRIKFYSFIGYNCCPFVPIFDNICTQALRYAFTDNRWLLSIGDTDE